MTAFGENCQDYVWIPAHVFHGNMSKLSYWIISGCNCKKGRFYIWQKLITTDGSVKGVTAGISKEFTPNQTIKSKECLDVLLKFLIMVQLMLTQKLLFVKVLLDATQHKLIVNTHTVVLQINTSCRKFIGSRNGNCSPNFAYFVTILMIS